MKSIQNLITWHKQLIRPLLLAAFAAIAVASSACAATIAQQAYLKASNAGAGDAFGWSVAMSGDTLVVGAYDEDSNATGVDGNQSNNSFVIPGAAYIFVREGTNWNQQAYLKASNTGASNYFGWTVAVSGDTVVVGAPGEDSSATGVNGNQSDNSAYGSGAAYVFVRSGTNWSQQAYLKASNPGGRPAGQVYGDLFGYSVAISGGTLVVGSVWEDSNATGVNGNQTNNSAPHSGAAYVFVREGSNWTQQAYLKASNAGADDQFGISVALTGDTAVVGARNEASIATGVDGNQSNNSAFQAGAAYVFVRDGTNWSQQAYLKASNAGAGDWFGFAVSVSGDAVVVGAPIEASNATGVNGNQTNNTASGAGAAYVFVRGGTNWSQQAYLKASNTGGGDRFGYSVAASGDMVAVGAAGFYGFVEGGGTGEASNTTGVNGNQTNNSAFGAGAAYVFVREGTDWSQQVYLKASNTGVNDYFGKFVAVSGDTVVVAAPGEASNATGVDGIQNNNSALNSGAAYVFTGLGFGPRLVLVPDGTGSLVLRFNGIPEVTYRLQRAPGLDGPWSDVATNTAPASGLIEYHETSPLPDAAFYRTVQP